MPIPNSTFPEDVKQHPIFTGAENVGIVSAECPSYPCEIPGGHEALGTHILLASGLRSVPTEGKYEMPIKAYIVHGPTREQMYQLGKKFGQESVIFSQGGKPEIMYTNGPKTGRSHPSLDPEFFQETPDDYYTKMGSGHLRLKFDKKRLYPVPLQEPFASDALKSRAQHEVSKNSISSAVLDILSEVLSKAEVESAPHPHNYPWFNSKSKHCIHHNGLGVLVTSKMAKSVSDPTDQNQVNAGYIQTSLPFGTVSKNNDKSGFHYPLEGKSADIDQLIRDYGFQIHNIGSTSKPDLDCKNYDTKYLPIVTDNNANFINREYSDSWRKLHELSHALTEPEVDAIYGDGKRTGVLGKHRSLNDAMRSTHWEFLASNKMRSLANSIGAPIPDEDFNRETNTVLNDSVNRVMTGNHTDPNSKSFTPYDHHVPIESALSLIREGAAKNGLNKSNNLKKDNKEPTVTIETPEKEYTVQQFKELLAKSLKNQICIFEASLLELRKREIAKDESVPLKKADWKPMMSPIAAGPKTRPSVAPSGPATTAGKIPAPPKPLGKVAPPGHEKQVLALKPKVGVESAFKIAWSQHGKEKGGGHEAKKIEEQSHTLCKKKDCKGTGCSDPSHMKKADTVPVAKPPGGNPMKLPVPKVGAPNVNPAAAPKVAGPGAPVMKSGLPQATGIAKIKDVAKSPISSIPKVDAAPVVPAAAASPGIPSPSSPQATGSAKIKAVSQKPIV